VAWSRQLALVISRQLLKDTTFGSCNGMATIYLADLRALSVEKRLERFENVGID
jgi:hypothetical protein